ncbi:MAG: hypothetical protein HYY01_14175 [Chloroflexi bacterium]|nr:hypothetical protein [Chloroflexota bacterium]
MKVLNPVGETRYEEMKDRLAPRPHTLEGKVIGFVDDGAGQAYFDRIAELLHDICRPAAIVKRVKPLLSSPSPQALLEDIRQRCDVVVVGTGI